MEEQNTQPPEQQTAAQEPATEQLVMPKVICEKHGDVGPHHFTVHAPEFGYDQQHFCLICAFEYLSMICSPVKAIYPEDPYKVDGGTEEDIATRETDESVPLDSSYPDGNGYWKEEKKDE
jgi:hypothetical protein